MRSSVSLALIVFLLVGLLPGLAAARRAGGDGLSDPGPYQYAGWQQVTVTRPDNTTFTARLYYPAYSSGQGAPYNGSGAPYPALSFGHGFLTSHTYYQSTLVHLATWGYFVIATESGMGLFPDHQAYANDMRYCLTYLEQQNANNGSWLYQQVDTAHFGIFGHSMGGGASILATAADARIRAMATLAAAETNPSAIAQMPNIQVPVRLIAGDQDGIVDWQQNTLLMYNAGRPPRQLPRIVGGWHCGFLDSNMFGCDSGPLARATQLAITRRLLTGFFNLYLQGDQTVWRAVWGPERDDDPIVPLHGEDAGHGLGPYMQAGQAAEGMAITYTLRITNTGPYNAVRYTLWAEDNDWPVTFPLPQTPPLNSGQATSVWAVVHVPAGTAPLTDTALLSARSERDGGTRTYGYVTTQARPPAYVRFSASTYSVNEVSGSALITVTLESAVDYAVRVHLATSDGTALAGRDYAAVSTTVIFAPGQAARSVAVPILDDALVEGDETLLLTLSNPSPGAAVAGPNPVVLTIHDDDTWPAVGFDAPGYSVIEAGGPAVLTVTLSAPYPEVVTVDYATTAGTATPGTDYDEVSGTLSFAPGTTVQTLTVPIRDDALNEPPFETLTLPLSNPTNAVLGPYNPVTLTIVDDDSLPVVAFSASWYTAGEAAGAARITVTLSHPYPLTATVDYATVAGTATPGEDYVAVSGTLAFAPGVAVQTFAVPIISDTLPEDIETVTLTLANPVNAVVFPLPSVLRITDQAVPTVQFSTSAYSVIEGWTWATLTLTLSQPYTWTVTVHYTTTAGTATPGEDYTAANGAVFFAPGEVTRQISFSIHDDDLIEGSETLFVSLYLPINATIGEPSTAVLTIVDDDVRPSFRIYLPLVVKG